MGRSSEGRGRREAGAERPIPGAGGGGGRSLGGGARVGPGQVLGAGQGRPLRALYGVARACSFDWRDLRVARFVRP